MQMNPVVDDAVALFDHSHTSLIEFADRRRDAMPGDRTRLVQNREATFPGAITQFHIFPIKWRQQIFKAAYCQKFVAIKHRRTAASKHRNQRLTTYLFFINFRRIALMNAQISPGKGPDLASAYFAI